MTTEEKLQIIVDKLLVKTQDNLCDWKKITAYKFSFRIPGHADIVITNNGNGNVIICIMRNDIEIASLNTEQKENSLSRLYRHIKTYHENYVNDQLGKLMDELQKLGDKPF